MFHAPACCVFKTVFSTHPHPASTIDSPAHPVSVPSHPSGKSSVVTSFETDTATYTYIANTTRYQVHTRYTHACGVWVVFLEHGGGALGIFKSPVCTYLRSNHGPLSASRFLGMWHSSCYCMRHSWLTKFGVICLNQLVLFVGARFLMGNFPRKSSSTKWRTLRLLCAAKSQEG